ncbi:hypothetical protein CYMTET_42771 [Cymbomonas tetramitiformis]|uniref:Uncharacterized protein n=1 Tax=Cymbomonas tetramitiformis TaxID=36881 RepID=A0AAE0C3L3_9CHLO|nr:hypothetical protein CYMTET_42771 [Cymbomonas tetramitiformis]
MWPGNTFCDKLFRELIRINPKLDLKEASMSDRVNVDRCVEQRVMGLRARSILNLSTLPVDVVYNGLRPLDILREMVTGTYITEISMSRSDTQNSTRVFSALEHGGVDPALYLEVRERVIDTVGPLYELIRDAARNTSVKLFEMIQQSALVQRVNSSEAMNTLSASVSKKYSRAVQNGGVILRHITKSQIGEKAQRIGSHLLPVAWETVKLTQAVRSTYLSAIDPTEGSEFQQRVHHYYRQQFNQTWHVNHDDTQSGAGNDSVVKERFEAPKVFKTDDRSVLDRLTELRYVRSSISRPGRPDASRAVAISRRLLGSDSDLETKQLSNSRSESCDVYEEVTDLVRNVTTFATTYYGFVSSDDSAVMNTHTFQRSMCTFLGTLRMLDSSDDSDDGVRFCRTDVYSTQRKQKGRGIFEILYEEYMLDIRNVLSISDTFKRDEVDKKFDITHTELSNSSRVSSCSDMTPTTFFICLTDLIMNWLSIDFDFNDDVTDVMVNELWQDKARAGDVEVRSIDDIPFYDAEFVGLYYPSDSLLLNSELLPKGNVRFGMELFRTPIDNWASHPHTWRKVPSQRNAFLEWYERWSENDFARTDADGNTLSSIHLNLQHTYTLVDFYPYRQNELDASWWTTDFYDQIGLIPAHVLMGMCEVRDFAQESVLTDVERWCLDDDTKSLGFGPDHADKWKILGYGSGDEVHRDWFKVPFEVSSFRFDLPKQRAYGLLRHGIDYPDPLHRISRDASLSRASINEIVAESVQDRSVILRLDIHEDNFFDNATVRDLAYRCVCYEYVKSNTIEKCLEDERCIAPKKSFFSLRGYTETPYFVYDNGGWWDCRFSSTDTESPCTPIPQTLLNTVANMSSRGHEYELTRHVTSTTNRSPRYNELIACGRRNDRFPFLCTMLANVSLALVGIIIFKIVFGMQSVETSVVGGIAVLIATHLALRTSYEWEVGFYPAVPTCLADDLAHDLERYLLPRHIEWPVAWAKRRLDNDRLHDTVDCSANPYGFRDGIRNVFYLWKRHHPSSLHDVCYDRRSAWLCASFETYFYYYNDYDSLRVAQENGHDNVDDMVAVFDACQLRTILNFVPAATVVFVVLTATATASSLLVGTGVAVVMIILNMRTFVQYIVMYINVKIHILTMMVAYDM